MLFFCILGHPLFVKKVLTFGLYAKQLTPNLKFWTSKIQDINILKTNWMPNMFFFVNPAINKLFNFSDT